MLRVAVCVVFLVVHFSLLATLRAAEPALPAAPAPTAGEAATLAVLAQPTGVDFDEQPLSDVFDFLSHKHKLEIQMDNKALTDAGIGSDTPVSLTLEGIQLRSALRLILTELDLTYVVRDGYLFITSKSEAESMLTTKAYAVGDLVTLESEFRPALHGPSAGEDYASLIDLITSTVAPTTWDEVGGPGSIRAFGNSHTITVSQTEEAHEELADLLSALRRVRDRQLAAAKDLPGIGRGEQRGEEPLQTYVYRLVGWPRHMPWPIVAGTRGGGSIGGSGVHYVADESASADTKPAAAATPASTPKPQTDEQNKQSKSAPPPPLIEWDMGHAGIWAVELAGSLPDLVEEETWQPRGKGSIRLLTGALVIRQTREVHGKIARFLEELLPSRVVTSAPRIAPAAQLPAPGPRLDWPYAAEPQNAENEAQVEAAFAKKCNAEFHETPLAGAVQSLVADTPIKLWIDHRALTDAGIGTDTPITRSIHNVAIRAAFKLILAELDLTYIIRHGVLTITSKSEAENMLSTRVYPVFDLIASVPAAAEQNARTSFRTLESASGMLNGMPPRAASDISPLIDNITSNIAVTTWDEVGGPGAIRQFVNSGALVISQTTEVHEEIAAYLRALRQVAGVDKK